MSEILEYDAYAGIGATETPDNVCRLMSGIANAMSDLGYVLRSGGADGADKAFELGSFGLKEIYLPWKGFNGSDSPLYLDHLYERWPGLESALEQLSAEIHPRWSACSPAAKKLHRRNALQILGPTLKNPCRVVVCWTKGGKLAGGTAQGLRLAAKYNIPVYNLAVDEDRIRLYHKFNMGGRLMAHL